MTEEARRPTPPTGDLGSLLQSLLPGLAWTSSTLDRAGRTQAAAAVESLRRLNVPLEQTLARHREFEAALADAAQRLADLATQLDQMARTYAQLNRGLEASVEPYLRYVDQLDRYASGRLGTPD
jgi:ABC-type transporter Mla subunit MlaD